MIRISSGRVTQRNDFFIASRFPSLKGAMLFMAWTGQTYRPTADMDFLGFGEDSSERIAEIFRSFCDLEVEPDGLTFDATTVKAGPIREEQEYQGQRVTLTAFLEKARIPLQVDVGFGDVVTPKAEKIDYPTILEFPAPSIRACPPETVVAEKFQAMVMLGIANSRMKDFYDLHVLARDFTFDGAALAQAINATFERRKTDIPSEAPLALTNVKWSDIDWTTDEAAEHSIHRAVLSYIRGPALPSVVIS